MLPPNIVVDNTKALGFGQLEGVCKGMKSNGSQMKYLIGEILLVGSFLKWVRLDLLTIDIYIIF